MSKFNSPDVRKTAKFAACKSPINAFPELVPENDLMEPTRRLSKEELDRLVKESIDAHTRQTHPAPPYLDNILELEFE
jgi:hypothetical protein